MFHWALPLSIMVALRKFWILEDFRFHLFRLGMLNLYLLPRVIVRTDASVTCVKHWHLGNITASKYVQSSCEGKEKKLYKLYLKLYLTESNCGFFFFL